MRKVARIFYLPYQWLVFLPLVAAATVLFGTAAVFLSLAVGKKTGSYIGGAMWSKLIALLTPIVVKVRGKEFIDRKKSYVIIANHQSQYDIFVLYGWLGIDFKWVMKKELRKIPGLGFGSAAVGHIFIDRSDPLAAEKTIENARKILVNGTSICFFPEGTRSRDGSLGRFKKSAFRMAVDLGLPLLPLTINGTREILPARSARLFPGKVQLIIHPPVDVKAFSGNINELISVSKKEIEKGLKRVAGKNESRTKY